jgi:hypothetical protein
LVVVFNQLHGIETDPDAARVRAGGFAEPRRAEVVNAKKMSIWSTPLSLYNCLVDVTASDQNSISCTGFDTLPPIKPAARTGRRRTEDTPSSMEIAICGDVISNNNGRRLGTYD